MRVAERVGFGVRREDLKEAHTDCYIVDRVRSALQVRKGCHTESQGNQFHLLLGAVAPERERERCREGMIRRVAERIGVQRGTRCLMEPGVLFRPRAFEQAISRREEFERCGFPLFGIGPSLSDRPLEVGEEAVSHGRECTVVEIDQCVGTCKLGFEASGVMAVRQYMSLGKGKGGARLSRPPR